MTETNSAAESLELVTKNAASLLKEFRPEATKENFEQDRQALREVMKALGNPRSLGIFVEGANIKLVVCPGFQRELDQLAAKGSATAQGLFKKASEFYGWDSAETPNVKGMQTGTWTITRNEYGNISRHNYRSPESMGEGMKRNLMVSSGWTTEDGTAEDWVNALSAKTKEITTILGNDAGFKEKTQTAMAQLKTAVS